MTDINLRILLSAQNAASGIIKAVVGDLKGPGGLQGALTAVGVAAAGMAVALGVEAVNKASAFQNAMLQNVAHAGLAKNQFDAVSQSVLQMSTDVGQMPTELATALYPVLSGFSGISNGAAKAQTSLEALRLSAMAVTGTTVDTTTVSNALVGSFNALGLQTNNTATNISRLKTLADQMEATIIAGNMHWDLYAAAASKVAIAIKGTNIQWTEANAALATMTNQSMSATKASTYLSNLFIQLGIKTDSLAKNAAKLGGTYSYVETTTKTLAGHTVIWHGLIGHTADRIETLHKTVHATMGIGFDEAAFKTMNLAQKMQYLTDITHGNQGELLKLLGGNATALKTYNMLYPSMKAYQNNLEAIKNSHGAAATAFQTASSGFQSAQNRMKAAIDVLLIDLGTQLLPVLSKVLDWVTPLIKRFADWVVNSRDLHTWLNNVGSFLQYQFLPAVQNVAGAVQSFVSWMQQGSAPAQALKGVLEGVGFAIAAMKVAKAAQDIASMAKNAADFVAGPGKNLVAYFTNDLQTAAQNAGTSVTNLGNDADIAGPKVTTLGTDTATAGTEIATAGNEAAVTGSEVETMGNEAAVASGKLSGLIGLASKLGGLSLLASQWGDSQAAGAAQSQLDKAANLGVNKAWLQYEWEKIHGFQNFGPMPDINNMTTAQQSQIMSDWGKTHGGQAFPWLKASFASGVSNFSGGLAYVHGGEVLSNLAPGTNVTPASRVNLGGGPSITINVSTMAGSRAEIIRMVDLIEAEMASRFRGQTSYGFGGVV